MLTLKVKNSGRTAQWDRSVMKQCSALPQGITLDILLPSNSRAGTTLLISFVVLPCWVTCFFAVGLCSVML
jgi:hypothetical protein